MNKFKLKMTKELKIRLLSTLVCLIMVIGLFPSAMVKAEDPTDKQFDAMINLTDAPAGFDANDTLNPYGATVGQPFPFLLQNELFLYQTASDANGGARQWATAYDTYTGEGNGNLNLAYDQPYNKGSFNSYIKEYNSYKYAYVEAVAFNPSGSGRDDCIAYVGFGNHGSDFGAYVWVLDTKNNRQSPTYYLGNCNWMKGDALELYQGGNFSAITAGDFYGDGSDDIIVYAPLDGTDYGLMQLKYVYSSNEVRLNFNGGGCYKAMLNPKYVNEGFGQAMANTTDPENKLSVDLDVGDVNADGFEDLCVLSYVNRADGSSGGYDWDEIDYRYYTPYLRVFWGRERYEATEGYRSGNGDFIYKNGDSATKYISMAAPSLTAADVDGDSRDDVVIAGYTNNIVTKDKNHNDCDGNPFSIDINALSIATYSDKGNGMQNAGYARTNANGRLKNADGGFFKNADDLWQPMGVEGVAINGPGAAEQVFIGGTLYTVSGNSAVAAYIRATLLRATTPQELL